MLRHFIYSSDRVSVFPPMVKLIELLPIYQGAAILDINKYKEVQNSWF